MAIKDFQQFFSAYFRGIGGQRSALEPEDNYVGRALNYEMSPGNSLRGRVGCQNSGAYGFFAIFPYRYTRTQDQYDIVYQTAAGTYPSQTASLATTKTSADGASRERLVAINQQVWMLDTMDVTITQTNAGTYTWYSYVNGSNINFVIKKDGVSILDTSLGSELSSYTTIYSLLGTIDGLADLAVSRSTRGTCYPVAIVNGNQTTSAQTDPAYGDRWRITVDSGHTFSSGDIISFIPSGTDILFGGFVIATTSTTIDYVGTQVTLADDQVLGYMGQSAASFPISTASSESSGSLVISFPYWRLIPEGDKELGSIYLSSLGVYAARTAGSFYAPPVAENALGNLYIASSASSVLFSGCARNLVRFDGQQPGRAGLPTPSMSIASNSGAGGLSGTFKYKVFYRRYDHQGNIWDGPVCDAQTITLSSDSTEIQILPPIYSAITGFQGRSCVKNTTETPATGEAFYVSDTAGTPADAFIQPGDIICLKNADTPIATGLWDNNILTIATGAMVKTICTAYSARATTISPTSSSIRVEASLGFQINDGSPVSTGLTAVYLRTASGGNQFYVLAEVPVQGYSVNQYLYDEVADAVLTAGEQYIEREIGKEHNAPPECSLVCQHQGGLVVARGLTSPNTVSFSTAEGIEYFPTASNAFDVPSTQSGSITAIISDSDDRLAVFKERAYYDVVGDLDGATFAINVRNEGDYGITSQASLVRLPLGIVGLSRNGLVIVSDGFLDPHVFEEVNARIVGQSYNYSWAVAANDSFNRNYIISIPQVSGEPVSYTVDYSRRDANPEMFYTKVLERSYATKIDQAGGMAMVGDTLYHLSTTSPYCVFRRLSRFDGDSPSGNGDGDSYIDNTNAIQYILESPVINRGDPSLPKTPIRARIWSIVNNYVNEVWVPFSVTVETAASPLIQHLGSPTNNALDTVINFVAETDIAHEVKLVNCKTNFFIMRLTTNTIRTAPFITGYELEFAESYDKEDIVIK